MLKGKLIKISVSAFLVLMALWVAVPKVYVHSLLHHDHTVSVKGPETKIQAPTDEDCDFEEYNKPVYFNIFKFIGSFIPLKPQNTVNQLQELISISTISHAVSFLRGPPVSE